MDESKLLLVKGEAGLGNRILCLLSAILYARLTKRFLIIDWCDSYYSADRTNSFDRFFRYKGDNRITALPVTDSIAPAIWRNHLQKTVSEMFGKFARDTYRHPDTWSKLTIDLSSLDYAETCLVMWAYFEQIDILRKHFRGEFEKYRGKSTKTILGGLLRENLSLNEDIQSKVDDFTKDWQGRVTIGLHIRYSDKKSRIPTMLKKLDALVKSHPGARIFLTTDNIEVKDKILNKYPNALTTPKNYPNAGRPMHFGFKGSAPIKLGVEALIDICVLAACDYLILDESSAFAYVASMICKAPDHHIFNFQRAKWIPASTKHRLWIQKQKLEMKLFPSHMKIKEKR